MNHDEALKVPGPYDDPVWEVAHLTNGWWEQLLHLIKFDRENWVDAATETLNHHNDHQWGIKLIMYSVTSLRPELIAICNANIANYYAEYGEREAAWDAARAATG